MAGIDQFWAVLWVAVLDVALTARTAGPAATVRALRRYRLVLPRSSMRSGHQDIAARLRISPRTVAVHVSRLLTKTGCASRTELAVQHLTADRPPG